MTFIPDRPANRDMPSPNGEWSIVVQAGNSMQY